MSTDIGLKEQKTNDVIKTLEAELKEIQDRARVQKIRLLESQKEEVSGSVCSMPFSL